MKYPIIFSLFISSFLASAQTAPFDMHLEPMSIEGLGGLQSFAWGQSDGKWLIIGGRLDGLHQRQPFAAFDLAGHNNQLIVVDPVGGQKWSAPLTSLPASLQEQLSSTNMEFHQENDFLYLIGGYGYSATSADHITFPNLSAVNVPEVIDAVINGNSFTSNFRQITDTMFAVTGGYLHKIYDTYYLAGGQKFMGRYNPMGPTHGPGFVQHYTNAIRIFSISDDGINLNITHLNALVDPINLHRRDYNVVPQIMPSSEHGATAFSGVFQTSADLPFLNCVNFDSSGYTVNNSFSQYYNHYHCAHIPLYSESTNEMHTVFFGGIAQYFDSAGVLVQDDNVPFVKTIARVTRDASGAMAEFKLPIEMPTLLGAGSEFIPVNSIPQFDNQVIKLDNLTVDSTLLGYIYGGISSTAANIFFTNTGIQSSASNDIFKVYLIRNSELSTHELNGQSNSTLAMQVFPNPNDGNLLIKFNLAKESDVTVSVYDISGKMISESYLKNQSKGEKRFAIEVSDSVVKGVYFVTLKTNEEAATQKVILK